MKTMSAKPKELTLAERLAQAKKRYTEATDTDAKADFGWLIWRLEQKLSSAE